jgi:hypothetical protein
MRSLLTLLPGAAVTFLFALAALLRFYTGNDFSFHWQPISPIDWSLWAFAAAVLALLVDLGLKWNAGNRGRDRAIEADARATEERNRATEERNRATEERNRATEAREREARRGRIGYLRDIAMARYQLSPTPERQQELESIVVLLQQAYLSELLEQ